MKRFLIISLCCLLTACGFHLQNTLPLAPPLHLVYLQTPDPYGTLARSLRQLLKASHVTLADNPMQADTILNIEQNNQSQILLSVDATQQTRQYNLHTVVIFSVSDNKGHVLVPPQTAVEDRPVTIQASQILGGSNEVNLFYEQMQRSIASDIMNRLASTDITTMIETKPTP